MTAVVALSRLATTQVAATHLVRELVDLAGTHLPVDGAGAMLLVEGELVVVHATCTSVDRVEQLQQLRQAGPCHDSVVALHEVAVDDIRHSHRGPWDWYRVGAEEAGLRSVLAVPLVGRGRAWGVLDLYRSEPGAWDEELLSAARLLADVATSYVVMAHDRDRALQVQQELAHRSLHDGLTGLPNRALLFDRLDRALAGVSRHGGRVTIFFVDLDRFKSVNDTFGHAGGDEVLVQVSARIRGSLRERDTVARLSGDEFVVVCEQPPASVEEHDRLEAVVLERLHAALAAPVRVGGVDLVVSASVGAASSSAADLADVSSDDLLSAADAAMYRVKQRRHHELLIRGPGPALPRRAPHQLERELASALAGGELRVHYQPIVTARDLRLDSVEALLRWEHPEHGLLTAGDFIAEAESTGLIAPIGRWTIDTVCAQVRRWHDRLGPGSPRTAYVNLSARELADADLPTTIAESLARHGLVPAQLGLELLEASFIDNHLVGALQTLHDRGHPLSVDDFGTGYSSLSRLIQLPVSNAKLDKSVTAAIQDDPRARALVEAVVLVADKLALRVVGEGVENADQAALLAAAGCTLLQGFHVGGPQDGEVLAAQWEGDAQVAATHSA